MSPPCSEVGEDVGLLQGSPTRPVCPLTGFFLVHLTHQQGKGRLYGEGDQAWFVMSGTPVTSTARASTSSTTTTLSASRVETLGHRHLPLPRAPSDPEAGEPHAASSPARKQRKRKRKEKTKRERKRPRRTSGTPAITATSGTLHSDVQLPCLPQPQPLGLLAAQAAAKDVRDPTSPVVGSNHSPFQYSLIPLDHACLRTSLTP